MKKLALLFIIVLFFPASSCAEVFRLFFGPDFIVIDGVRVYEADFLARYEPTINIMFDDTWTLLSSEERFEENEGYKCPCGHDARPQRFLEWTIEYQDGNGDTRHFMFHNRWSFSYQVISYVERHITAYYREQFLDVYMEGVPAPPWAVIARVPRARVNWHLEENRELRRTTERYRRRVGSPENAIPLAQLTPANVFEQVPMYLSISLSLGGYYGPDQQDREENITEKIEHMIESMNQFTNYRLNAHIRLITLDGEDRRHWHWWNYIQGQQVFHVNSDCFPRYVFESYKGIFW